MLSLFLSFFAFTLSTAYLVDNNPYLREEELFDPAENRKLTLRWFVDRKAITFNITAETRSWIVLGFAKNTSEAALPRADFVIGGVNPEGNQPFYTDCHFTPEGTPAPDKNQDWELNSGWEKDNQTFLSLTRKLNTGDPEDYLITDAKVTLMWALGTTPDSALCSAFNPALRGQSNAYLLDPDYVPKILQKHWGSRNSTAELPRKGLDSHIPSDTKLYSIQKKVSLASNDSSYICSFHKGPKLAPSKRHHLIGFDIQFMDGEATRRNVHHIVVSHCRPPRAGISARELFEPHLSNPGEPCYIYKNVPGLGIHFPIHFCNDVFIVWGIGGRPIFPYPSGIPFGDPALEQEYLNLEIHYDNPQHISGLEVDLRLDFFYTGEPREKDGNFLFIGYSVPGLPETLLIPPHSTQHRIYAHCSPECISNMTTVYSSAPEGVFFTAVMLHAHDSAVALKLRHFRGRKELPWIISDVNHDPNTQMVRQLPEPRRVLPGDHIVMECRYSTNGTTHLGGYRAKDEMCVAMIFYHELVPDFNFCGSGMTSIALRKKLLGFQNVSWVQADGKHTINWVVQDGGSELAGMTAPQVADTKVEWTEERRKELQRFHATRTQGYHCSRNINRLTLEEYLKLPPSENKDSFGFSDDNVEGEAEKEPHNPINFPEGAEFYEPPEAQ